MDIPDELWVQVISESVDHRGTLFALVHVSSRMYRLAYTSLTHIDMKHSGIPPQRLSLLPNLTSLRCNVVSKLPPIHRLLNLYIHCECDGLIDLSSWRLTSLSILSTTDVKIPLSLIELSVSGNRTSIDLTGYTNIQRLKLPVGGLITGYDQLPIHTLEAIGIVPNIASMTQLRNLFINGDDSVTALPRYLTKLTIIHCNSHLDLSTLTMLSNLYVEQYSIQGLPVSLTNLTLDICKSVPLGHLTNLLSLSVYNNVHDDVTQLASLRYLKMHNRTITSLSSFTNLHTLKLFWTNIADGGLTLMQNIKRLTLGLGCDIHNEQLSTMTSLTYLSLRDPAITSTCVSKLTNLTKLNLDHDRIMHDFTMLTQLRRVKMRDCCSAEVRLPLYATLYADGARMILKRHEDHLVSGNDAC